VTQTDTEVIVPLETALTLTGQSNSVSFVEFSLKDPNSETKVLNQIVKLLPENHEIVKTQQVAIFAQDINSQIISFLNLWSLAIYAVVVAASYVIATRLVTEAKFELTMFRTLGAKRLFTIKLVFVHTLIVAFLGAVLGLAVGIAGAQVASTVVRWMWGTSCCRLFLI
jgi:ABC-type lipoprotein release transport system permease subunit